MDPVESNLPVVGPGITAVLGVRLWYVFSNTTPSVLL